MTDSLRVRIRSTLRTKLLSTPGLPEKVSLEGWAFEPKIGEAWVRENMKPATSRPLTLGPGGWIRHSGMYMVECFAPVHDEQGSREADLLADAVADHFHAGIQLNTHSQIVTVEYSQAGSPVREKNFIMVPVSISYHADTINPST